MYRIKQTDSAVKMRDNIYYSTKTIRFYAINTNINVATEAEFVRGII